MWFRSTGNTDTAIERQRALPFSRLITCSGLDFSQGCELAAVKESAVWHAGGGLAQGAEQAGGRCIRARREAVRPRVAAAGDFSRGRTHPRLCVSSRPVRPPSFWMYFVLCLLLLSFAFMPDMDVIPYDLLATPLRCCLRPHNSHRRRLSCMHICLQELHAEKSHCVLPQNAVTTDHPNSLHCSGPLST